MRCPPSRPLAAGGADLAGFMFTIKAFSLSTQHATGWRRCPATCARRRKRPAGWAQPEILDPSVTNQAWERVLSALEPSARRKLGPVILLQSAWVPDRRARKGDIVAVW